MAPLRSTEEWAPLRATPSRSIDDPMGVGVVDVVIGVGVGVVIGVGVGVGVVILMLKRPVNGLRLLVKFRVM